MTRQFYPACRVELAALGGADAFACDDAEVWIEGEAILISYFDEDGIVVLEGRTDEKSGGWALGARSRPRRATLDRASESLRPGDEAQTVYSGFVEEHGERANWILRLGRSADEEKEE